MDNLWRGLTQSWQFNSTFAYLCSNGKSTHGYLLSNVFLAIHTFLEVDLISSQANNQKQPGLTGGFESWVHCLAIWAFTSLIDRFSSLKYQEWTSTGSKGDGPFLAKKQKVCSRPLLQLSIVIYLIWFIINRVFYLGSQIHVYEMIGN